eukprot:jgi/Orpsp1_1/1181353/evm.model.c7180000076929.1
MNLELLVDFCNEVLSKITFGPLIVYITRFYYIILISAVIITYAFPFLRERFIVFGKLLNNPKKFIHVPKKWFLHFYIVGAIWSTYLLIEYYFYIFRPNIKFPLLNFISNYWNYNLNLNSETYIQFTINENMEYTFQQLPIESFIGIILMSIHMFRRTLESFFITKFSDAKMHFGHYIVGITFYLFTAFSIIIESINNGKNFNIKDINFCHILSIMLNIFAQSQQYWCHKYLASLRPNVSPRDKHIKAVYKLPTDRWFKLVDSPQYFFEILIYFSIYMLSVLKNYTLLCVVLWTII